MGTSPPGVRVTSETGPLERVICHEPGPELDVVTPGNRSAYLFDDLLDVQESRSEHRVFRAVLEQFAEVLEVESLLRDVLELPEARHFLLANAHSGVRAWAEGTDASELARLFIEGKASEPAADSGFLAQLVNEAGYLLPPLPNLFFTRDAACVVGDGVLISSMANDVRWSEQLIMRAIFEHHPIMASPDVLYDGMAERRLNVRIEGGDVHVLREDLLMIGVSERTTAAAVDLLAGELFRAGEVTDIIVVLLPRQRSSIHLDMIFTVLDRDLCCVYPPHFRGPTRLPVFHLSVRHEAAREFPTVFAALEAVGFPLEPVYCGGSRRTDQEREQWGSGCNMFAVGPGQVMAYARNDQTLVALVRDGGMQLIEAEDLLSGAAVAPPGDRFVVAFRGAELVRGGGGPRCMTMPVRRRDA